MPEKTSQNSDSSFMFSGKMKEKNIYKIYTPTRHCIYTYSGPLTGMSFR